MQDAVQPDIMEVDRKITLLRLPLRLLLFHPRLEQIHQNIVTTSL
jgi:hypothetical protein